MRPRGVLPIGHAIRDLVAVPLAQGTTASRTGVPAVARPEIIATALGQRRLGRPVPRVNGAHGRTTDGALASHGSDRCQEVVDGPGCPPMVSVPWTGPPPRQPVPHAVSSTSMTAVYVSPELACPARRFDSRVLADGVTSPKPARPRPKRRAI